MWILLVQACASATRQSLDLHAISERPRSVEHHANSNSLPQHHHTSSRRHSNPGHGSGTNTFNNNHPHTAYVPAAVTSSHSDVQQAALPSQVLMPDPASSTSQAHDTAAAAPITAVKRHRKRSHHHGRRSRASMEGGRGDDGSTDTDSLHSQDSHGPAGTATQHVSSQKVPPVPGGKVQSSLKVHAPVWVPMSSSSQVAAVAGAGGSSTSPAAAGEQLPVSQSATAGTAPKPLGFKRNGSCSDLAANALGSSPPHHLVAAMQGLAC